MQMIFRAVCTGDPQRRSLIKGHGIFLPIRSQYANIYVNQSNNIIGKAVYCTQENCIPTILGLTMSKSQVSLGNRAEIIHLGPKQYTPLTGVCQKCF